MKVLTTICFIATCHCPFVCSEHILIKFSDGDPIPSIITREKELTAQEMSISEDGQTLWVAYSTDQNEECVLFPKKTYVGYRNYALPVTESEMGEIHFILKTLALKSLASLWAAKSQLEHAGERIDHLHPLRFLECIFSDEELKVYIYNIKKRGSWVWSEFIKGFKSSFNEESGIGNMKPEYIEDFAHNLGIKLKDINGPIKKQKWDDLVKTLISIIPREGDPGRYDQ